VAVDIYVAGIYIATFALRLVVILGIFLCAMAIQLMLNGLADLGIITMLAQ
jgi:small neutral amino acid transporter SnatA (MarC family)